jgi:hypothetical protein
MRSSRTGGPEEVRHDQNSFADMLATVRFTHQAASTITTPPAATTTAIDGLWQASWTRDELENSPLLMGNGEVNDENWGTLSISFDGGTATETISNNNQEHTDDFTYKIDGDIVTFQRDNGERFVMRWVIKGDQLTLARDDSLGVDPTPYVIKPFTRQP